MIQRKAIYITLSILLGIAACSQEQISLPIPLGKIEYILADIHIAEGMVLDFSLAKRDSVAAIYYDLICKQYEVEQEDLYATLEILHEQPELMDSLYNKVLIQLQIKEQKFEEKKRQQNSKVH